MAIDLKKGGLDEDVLKEMWYATFLRDWDMLEPFIMELRRAVPNPKIAAEFEKLIVRWKRNSRMK